MRFPRRDLLATLYVVVAVALYGLWLADVEMAGLASIRSLGIVILALGFAASATAVVPGFEGLLHGSKLYLAAMALIGVVALVAGVLLLLDGTEVMLTVVMAAMVAMWIASTIRHVMAAAPTRIGRSVPA